MRVSIILLLLVGSVLLLATEAQKLRPSPPGIPGGHRPPTKPKLPLCEEPTDSEDATEDTTTTTDDENGQPRPTRSIRALKRRPITSPKPTCRPVMANESPKPKPNAQTQPRPSVSPKPKPNAQTRPRPSVSPKPKPNAQTRPRPSVSPKPKPNAQTRPRPSVSPPAIPSTRPTRPGTRPTRPTRPGTRPTRPTRPPPTKPMEGGTDTASQRGK